MKPTSILLVFFVAMNLFAGVMDASGVSALLGLEVGVGASEAYAGYGQAGSIPTGTGGGDDLFGLYNVVGGFLMNLYSDIYPGLDMLTRLGTPVWLTYGFLANIFNVLILIRGISFVRGYNL